MTGTHVTLTKPVADFLTTLMPYGYTETTTFETSHVRTVFATRTIDVEFLHTLDGKLICAYVYGYQGPKPYHVGAMGVAVIGTKVTKVKNDGYATLVNTKMGQAFYRMVKEVAAMANAC